MAAQNGAQDISKLGREGFRNSTRP